MESIVDLNKEIVFASSDSDASHLIGKLLRRGQLRKIAPRIYTTNLLDSPESIVRRNILSILAWRFPNMIISHRSASEMRLTSSGHFFLTGKSSRKITDLPGVVITILQGPDPDEKDMKYGKMFIAGEYRWMLENMQSSRKSSDESKVMDVAVIERRLENVLVAGGEKALNDYRDTLRKTAQRLGMMKEFEKINLLISALLSTHSMDLLTSSSAKATAAGMPYDERRLRLFETLYDALRECYFVPRSVNVLSEDEERNIAFFESYFSNYIEGTEFALEEARQIVETGLPMTMRREDSHDILGTFNVLSSRSEMMRYPTDSQELIQLLCHRHSLLLAGRPDLNPGHLKEKNNRAGNTIFVDAERVVGTLDAGFRYYAALTSPLAKAIYMMFLISEVHPFYDGNGRIARVMMNAELFRAGEAKIIVPNVYREDYLLSLRQLSRNGEPQAFIKVMETLHHFSSTLYGRTFQQMTDYLYFCNAFASPEEKHLRFEKQEKI